MIVLREPAGPQDSNRGAVMVEYALLLGLVAVAVAAFLPAFAGAIGSLLDFAWPD